MSYWFGCLCIRLYLASIGSQVELAKQNISFKYFLFLKDLNGLKEIRDNEDFEI